MLEGPNLQVQCQACHSLLEVEAALWKSILGFRNFAAELGIVPGKTRGSSLTSGEFKFLIRWGPEAPSCAACGAVLQADSVPSGAAGTLSCVCGSSIPTSAVPAWLTAVEPLALQVFGAPSGAIPTGETLKTDALRPVLFTCPQCGANLKVTGDAQRVLTCNYCDTDVYLPDALWRKLHPVRKRSSFWVRYAP